ncbi:MAG: chromate transporter [Lentisphaeria bacterium]|nr:chromate transporter [Lentisphaeria bacterium]
MSLLAIFWLFFKIGIFTFGGGYAMIPLFHAELVSKLALVSNTEFGNVVALAQMTPGPVGLNFATYTGYLHGGGVFGALAGTVGIILPSLLLIPLLCHYLGKIEDNYLFQGFLRAVRPIILGLIFAAVIFFADTSLFTESLREMIFTRDFSNFQINYIGIAVFAVTFVLNLKTKLNVIILLLIAIGLTILLNLL